MNFNEEYYSVQSKEDPTVLTAHNIILENNTISWLDESEHERLFTIRKIISDDNNEFMFEKDVDEGGGVYMIKKLTRESYNKLIDLIEQNQDM
ncbi:MAG: hypothetical protein ABH832_02120 [bacterium]